MIYKKGEISVSFLISILLLVLGFVAVLIFYFNIGGTGQMDRTICHQSVVFRATLPTLVEDYIPLKCKTNKICITSGRILDILDISKNKSCSDFSGETGITTVKVKNVAEIEQIYAQEILDCWSMMGEGKVSLFNQYVPKTFGVGKIYPTCVICSRIAFDNKSIIEPNFDLSSMDVSRYMMTHKIPGKEISYFEAIASENGKVSIKDKLFESIPNVQEKDAELKTGETKVAVATLNSDGSSTKVTSTTISEELTAQAKDTILQTKPSAILFMQISSPDHADSFLNTLKLAAGATVTSFVLAPTITGNVLKTGAKACSSGPGALVCSILAIAGVAVQQVNVAYSRFVSAGYCGDLSVGSQARSGCSAIRTVNYDAQDISKYCQVIESIP